jgi:isopentenyl-diphosphate delta-isomerase
MLTNNDIILVDENDNVTGYGRKQEVHRLGLLHRAFSVLIYNNNNQMLLQRRALNKYHSPGLWTNACCSHPFPGESTPEAASRRLREELGFSCPLDYKGYFHYTAPFDNGLTENEIDHVFTGIWSQEVNPNAEEVWGIRWISLPDLKKWMDYKPGDFTVWFRIIAREQGLV